MLPLQFGSWPGPWGYKKIHTQLSWAQNLSCAINVKMPTKMPTIVGILTFISMINTSPERLKARNTYFFIILISMSSWNSVVSWAWKKFDNLGPGLIMDRNCLSLWWYFGKVIVFQKNQQTTKIIKNSKPCADPEGGGNRGSGPPPC